MKVTIITFEPEVKHLPIVVAGDFADARDYIKSKYDFAYLLDFPDDMWGQISSEIEYIVERSIALDYLADLVIGYDIAERFQYKKLATMNTIILANAPTTAPSAIPSWNGKHESTPVTSITKWEGRSYDEESGEASFTIRVYYEDDEYQRRAGSPGPADTDAFVRDLARAMGLI